MSVPLNGEDKTTQTVNPVKSIEDMTDREIAMETLLWLRQFGAAIQQIQSGGMGAMIKGMLPGLNRR